MRTVAAASFALVLAACGAAPGLLVDGGAPNLCGLAPCGGDLTGSWTYVSACNYAPSGCGNMPLLLAADQTLAFNADGHFEFSAGTTSTFVAPASCATPTSCQDAAGRACSLDADGRCTCTLRTPSPLPPVSGTFTLAGSAVILSPATGALVTGTYCVEGRTLRYRPDGNAALIVELMR